MLHGIAKSSTNFALVFPADAKLMWASEEGWSDDWDDDWDWQDDYRKWDEEAEEAADLAYAADRLSARIMFPVAIAESFLDWDFTDCYARAIRA